MISSAAPVVGVTELARRTIRRGDYVSCAQAFIDCKTPGSESKENYSIIGPGVTQSAAQVVNLTDKNVSDALIRFAQQESISHVVFGQSARSRWDILLRGSVLNRFLADLRDVTVQVVPMNKPARRG